MKSRIIAIAGSAALVALLAAGCTAKKPAAQAPSGDSSVVCTQQYDPVCGADGTTYPNDCVATKQKGVAVASRGACPAASTLDVNERKYLVWLLRERLDSDLETVSVHHLLTKKLDCNNCWDFYFSWGTKPRVVVKMTVREGDITFAVDTQGYNYLAKKQESPVKFPEVDDIKG